MTDKKNGKKESSISGTVAVWKNLVSLMRDSALLLLAVLLIAFPSTLNSILVNAGFEEGSFVGFKWKSKLVDSDAALKEARSTISDLQKKNNEMANALAEANAKLNDSSFQKRVAKLEKENKKLYAATQQVQASVSNTIASSAPLVDSILAQTSTHKWGVVFSGNPTLEIAKDELDSVAEKYNLPNAAIYNRKGSYRSVSVVSDRQQAIRILSRAKEWRDDAYIVNMSKWCPNFKKEAGIYECTLP